LTTFAIKVAAKGGGKLYLGATRTKRGTGRYDGLPNRE
jgi:hypothetical protein